MIATCAKCNELFDQVTPVASFCVKCSTLAELLAAADALNARVRAELNRPGAGEPRNAILAPLVERAARAIEKARSL